MKLKTSALLATGLFYSSLSGQAPEKISMPPNRLAHVLVIAQTKGFEHDSVPGAMANVWRMGHDSKLLGNHAAKRHGKHHQDEEGRQF